MQANGNVFSQEVDRGPGLLYDRLTTAAAAATQANYAFFTVGVSNTKTLSDTNLDGGIRLSPPNVFMVMSIGFIFGTTMLHADLATFLKNYYHRFFIGTSGKSFTEGPLHLFPGGAGIAGGIGGNHATTALQSFVNNGLADLNVCRRFPDWPRNIAPNVSFKVDVNGTSFSLAAAVASTIVSPAYGGLDLMCYLDGIRDREVS